MNKWLACSGVAIIVGAAAWAKSDAVHGAAQPPGAATVQIVPAGQKQVGSPGEKGATYYALEAQTTRLTTRFRDGHEAVSERGLAGSVRTTLRDRGGNERSKLRLNRIDDGHDMLNYEPAAGAAFQAVSDPKSVKPTLDWATRQAYSLEKDGSDHLVWEAGNMRRQGSARRNVEEDVERVETVWANGLVATLSREIYARRQITPGRFVEGPALVSELTQNGAQVGTAVWFEKNQVFAYSLPGLVAGMVVIGPEDLKANYGGWPFTPDTTWLNLQVIATHHFKTQLAKHGSVARACEPPSPNRLAEFFMPTVYANDAGCDDFHWLDGSVVRECCDDHDRCYSKSGCDSNTWWQFWRSWTCDRCNIAVVGCFFARGSADDRCIRRQVCAG